MGYFDFLIDECETPVENMRYVYLFDECWKEGELGSYPIKYGSLVKDLTKNDNGSISFTLEKTGERFKCNYGWAFAELTADNLVNIIEFYRLDEEYNKIKNKRDDSSKRIIRLNKD